jgi:protease-4
LPSRRSLITSIIALLPTSSLGAPWYLGFGWSSLKYVNYTTIVVIGALFFLWIGWHLSAKKWFTGPKPTIDLRGDLGGRRDPPRAPGGVAPSGWGLARRRAGRRSGRNGPRVAQWRAARGPGPAHLAPGFAAKRPDRSAQPGFVGALRMVAPGRPGGLDRDMTVKSLQDVVDKVSELREHRSGSLVLELDLTEPLAQGTPTDPLSALRQRRQGRLKTVLEGLRRAADDERVTLLVTKIGSARIGLGRAQELRDAVLAFRAAGKPAIAWAESFGEWSPGLVPYYLATAFDEIWLHPIGDVTFNGLTVGSPFVRGALDRVDVEPQFGQRYEYKNAADTLMRSTFSDAHREALSRVATSAFDQVVDGVAQARELAVERVRELADQAPICADDALAAGLVDRVGYRDELYAEVRSRAGESATLMYLTRYAHPNVSTQVPRAVRKPRRIALVWGLGAIHQGKSGRRPDGPHMGSDTITAALRAAVADERVDAIVFRVDSPGGSAVASDAIWREVGQARAAGKPVVVSMGDVAGSGGYYVAMGADVIVAEPATITGSIGVLAGKLVMDGLWNRLGITYDSIALGDLARLFSSRTAYSPAEHAALERWLDRIYETFVGKVAAGRGLSRDAVHAVAKGRIWTGADAAERGLVDELGGLDRAVEIARERGGIAAGAEVDVVSFPMISPLSRVRPPRSSESPGAADASVWTGWGSFAGLAARLGLPPEGPLAMPFLPTWS